LARGQLSVEFFLIVAFILVLTTMILSNAENSLTETRTLDRMALAKAAVVEASQAANLVAVQGNGSSIKRLLFVPPETICFLYDDADGVLYCDTGKNTVRGPPLLVEPSVYAPCLSSGWMTVEITSNETLGINCTISA